MNNTLDRRLEKVETIASSSLSTTPLWTPQPGPQTQAFGSDADVILYGGAAGSGKSDLALGLALMKHKRIAIFRRNSTEMSSLIDRLAEILGHRDGLNQVNGIWRLGSQIFNFAPPQTLVMNVNIRGGLKTYWSLMKRLTFYTNKSSFCPLG